MWSTSVLIKDVPHHESPRRLGDVSQSEAIVFATLLAILGTALLATTVNVLTAVLTVALGRYAFIYTMFLKRATPQNIVIGGLAGAAPPCLAGPQ